MKQFSDDSSYVEVFITGSVINGSRMGFAIDFLTYMSGRPGLQGSWDVFLEDKINSEMAAEAAGMAYALQRISLNHTVTVNFASPRLPKLLDGQMSSTSQIPETLLRGLTAAIDYVDTLNSVGLTPRILALKSRSKEAAGQSKNEVVLSSITEIVTGLDRAFD